MFNPLRRLFASPAKETPIQAKPPMGESAWRSDTFFAGANGVWNPDELVRIKGAGIYRQMLRDPQVKALYDLAINSTIGRDFDFTLTDQESPEQIACRDFFLWNISRGMAGTFQGGMRRIMLAHVFGQSVTEKIYGTAEWEGATRWVLRGMKERDIGSFEFEADPHGNLSELWQNQGGARRKMDMRKFVHFVNKPEYDPIWGESDLRAAYRAWWDKDNVLKMWNIRIERLAGGFLAVNGGSLSGPERENLKDILKNVSAMSGILLPEGVTMEIHQAAQTGEFLERLEFSNREIAKALLTPDMLGMGDKGEGGSRALGDTQLEIFFQIAKARGDALADTLNEQLFRELAWWNFGLADYPTFVFEPFTEGQKARIVERWRAALHSGAVHQQIGDENRLRRLMGFDEIGEDEYAEATKPVAQPGPEPEPVPDPNLQASPDDDPVDDPEDPASVRAARAGNGGPMQWRDRVDFRRVASDLDARESSFTEKLSPALESMAGEVQATIADIMRQIEGAPKADLNLVNIVAALDTAVTAESKSRLRQTLRDGLASGYESGREMAVSAVEQASRRATTGAMRERIGMTAKLSRRKAHNFKQGAWSVAHFVSGIDLQTAEQYFDAKAFWLTGNLSNEVVQAAKQIILDGIRDEKSIQAMRDELNELLAPYLGTVQPDGTRSAAARAETIARTNVLDSFNQAALSVYADPDLGDFVEALEYSAIMDSRTTPFCRAYDGRVFARNDPVWSTITPPNHFNCRSTTIPVTALDDWEGSTRPPADVQPAPGFGAS